MPTKLQNLKQRIRARGAKWRAKRTAVSELPVERKKLRLGFKPAPRTPKVRDREKLAAVRARSPRSLAAAAAVSPFPSRFDWRDVGGADFTTPARDQQDCGACVAFAVCAAIETMVRHDRNDGASPFVLSPAHLFYVHGRAAGSVCAGGWNPEGALDACVDPGVADEACYPYVPGDPQGPPPLCSDWQSRATRVTAWHLTTSHTDMKSWVSTRGPMVAGMSVFDDFFDYAGGIYRHVTGPFVGGHVVCVVGYDQAAGCWICKNSFGPHWGEQGFFRIPYRHCGIDAVMWAIEGLV
jgi:hypothetical protein